MITNAPIYLPEKAQFPQMLKEPIQPQPTWKRKKCKSCAERPFCKECGHPWQAACKYYRQRK